MATTETELTAKTEAAPAVATVVKVIPKKNDSALDKVLHLLSSVRFGIVMLGILLTCCMIGMFVMQVNVDGFQKYYLNLTPAQKLVYGALGFFDIYRKGAPLPPVPLEFLRPFWPSSLNYFQLLLSITGLNIILASIDRFPAAWQYIRKPKLTASPKFIAAQMFNEEVVERADPQVAVEKVRNAWRKLGFRSRVNEEGSRVTVFAQRHTWNRLGAYVVHVALLTIFTGGFLTSRYRESGQMTVTPGKSTRSFISQEITLDGPQTDRKTLPFDVVCTDLRQILITPEGSMQPQNTIDWLSYITVNDGARKEDLVVHLNNVGDYKGYRFFQSDWERSAYAREIKLRLEPVNGGEGQTVSIPRDGSAQVEGLGRIYYKDFFSDFTLGREGRGQSASLEYDNPVAELQIELPGGNQRRLFAFFHREAEEALLKQIRAAAGDEAVEKASTVNGFRISLKEFEKVWSGHVLTVSNDPGRTPVYMGFTLLILALSGVFFFSHQRVWAVIEANGAGTKIYFGGNTNRNRPAFEGRFNSLVQSVTGGPKNE